MMGDGILDKVLLNHIYMNYHSINTSVQALKDICFSVKEGEFVSIVGPSGCGKSTLLNIISGLTPASYGDVFIGGEKINTISRKLGYMFQRDHLFDWLNVWDNITLGIKIQHKSKNDYYKKMNSMLLNYGLADFKFHYPRELSGGMRQKVALLRTLALDPEVLLLDEPFSALDYQTRLNIGDEIYKIIKKEEKTVIMVTHDISEAISMSDRVVVLSQRPGKINRIFDITFSAPHISPVKSREDPNFRIYFNEIWKELNR